MNEVKVLEDFFSYLRFPSISADSSHVGDCHACAKWLQQKFQELGFQSELYPVAGPPVVMARSPLVAGRKTVLIYGHYDVQPVDPLELWDHPPFVPYVKEGKVIARGSTDNKGQTLSHILGTEQLLRSGQELPVNLVYLLEGEEEIGSPHLESFLRCHQKELRCDVILISDTSMVAPQFPAITCGLRGIACLEIKVSGPKSDLHSGMFGGAIANPAQVLVGLLAQLHSPQGTIMVPGFYEDVVEPHPEELFGWSQLPFGDRDILGLTGAPALFGEHSRSSLERIWSRPTLEINGLSSGYQGEGSKTIVPRQALAKISCRLVPNQDATKIAAQLINHLQSLCPKTVRLEVVYDHGGAPFYSDPTSAAGSAVRESLKQVFGRSPALTREGLSIPIVSLLQQTLGPSPFLIGLGLPDCQAHAPNESFPLEQLFQGIVLHQRLLENLANC